MSKTRNRGYSPHVSARIVANHRQLTPERRYDDGSQYYHFNGTWGRSVRIVRDDSTPMGMHVIPALGIAAHQVEIDGTPITVEWTCSVSATWLRHDPSTTPRSVIRIDSVAKAIPTN